MPPVFAHGRLRLYLLKLLDEAPRHGYEVIRLLEERFQGLYAPSAGTVYPRLAKLEAEGLVTHATEGGRKVYSITDAGREELAGRTGELADLELEIRESVSELAAEIRDDVRGAAGKLRSEMRAAADETRHTGSGPGRKGDRESPSVTSATSGTSATRRRGARPRRSCARPSRSGRSRPAGRRTSPAAPARRPSGPVARPRRPRTGRASRCRTPRARSRSTSPGATGPRAYGRDWPRSPASWRASPGRAAAPYVKPEPTAADPDWGRDTAATGDPARDLDRLLDRFRDDIRDAARDRGVTAEQLTEARGHLSTAAARIGALLRKDDDGEK